MKKILFVCGSLEPGHDGVGDYTRVVAGAIHSRGFEALIISINDRNVSSFLRETQFSAGQKINVVRISKTLPYTNRKNEYNKILYEFNPQWISLQYVPYAFSSKGIPLKLPHFLKNHNLGIRWHFMIHEAYIGANGNFKKSIIQRLQIWVLKMLCNKLQPRVIHTTIPSYQSQLNTIGIESEILGLFGNIPISKGTIKDDSDKTFRGVYFGAPPKEDKFQVFIDAINQYLSKTDEVLEIVLCGQSGEMGKQFASALRKSVTPRHFYVTEKGRMAAEDLSKLFLKMDFAIARIPPHLLGKSGSAIALLEHGLPLWLPLAKSQDEIKENIDFRVNQCFVDIFKLRKCKQSFGSGSRIDEIANHFINELIRSEDIDL